MSQIIIIDLSESFDNKKHQFFDDLDNINEKYSEWFSKRNPFNNEKEKPDEPDSIYYHISWIEVSRGSQYALLRILLCDERPREIEREIMDSFKKRFDKFDSHKVT